MYPPSIDGSKPISGVSQETPYYKSSGRSPVCLAMRANMTRNARKARYVTIAAWLLALQVAGILALAVAAALLPP